MGRCVRNGFTSGVKMNSLCIFKTEVKTKKNKKQHVSCSYMHQLFQDAWCALGVAGCFYLWVAFLSNSRETSGRFPYSNTFSYVSFEILTSNIRKTPLT